MTKLTLELPDTAAAKLTDMSPKQLAELSLALGYTVLSVTVHSSEVTRRRRANEELYHATTRDSGGYSYLVDVPWDTVDAILHTFHDCYVERTGDVNSASLEVFIGVDPRDEVSFVTVFTSP